VGRSNNKAFQSRPAAREPNLALRTLAREAVAYHKMAALDKDRRAVAFDYEYGT
jgi:hypothetical protein